MAKRDSASRPSSSIMTIDELAAHFGVSRSTVKNWYHRDGVIRPCIAIGNVVRFDLVECEQRLSARSRKAHGLSNQ
ncbi:helix-turn-helix transcriptional regulator [Methylobacterium komagatae]|uniref:Helix-turn-helix transcriptional regulator n=1 Tax=Methylobacterium komagatae TaxID=374425 RepID=A0ABW2BF60_9HYPH